MTTRIGCSRQRVPRHAGAAIIEFALIALVFFAVLIGILEFGRMLFYWNSVTEATRLGARIAVVCDIGEANIKTRMQQISPYLPAGSINVAYAPSGCGPTNCESVTVSVAPGVSFDLMVPLVPLSVSLPGFSTTLPRESLDSSGGNPTCRAT